MSWIRQVDPTEAEGLLKRIFDEAIGREGRIWNIVRILSLNPEALRDVLSLYLTTMKRESPLTTVQRELLAVVVSAELACEY